MHILGLQGMSRRIDTYGEGFGFELWNFVASVGAFVIALGVALLLYNVWKSKREAADLPPPGPDPWDARSLEWMVQSPTPEHNFDEIPTVNGLDEWWHRKYGYDEQHRVVRVATAEEAAQPGTATGVHLPSPSFWPLVVAVGMPLIGYGLIFNLWLCIPGALLTAGGLYAWALEPVDDPDAAHGHDDDHGDGDGPDGDDSDGDAAEPVTAGAGGEA